MEKLQPCLTLKQQHLLLEENMILTLDIENTVSKLPSGKVMLDPFTEGNALVLVCTRDESQNENSYFFQTKQQCWSVITLNMS